MQQPRRPGEAWGCSRPPEGAKHGDFLGGNQEGLEPHRPPLSRAPGPAAYLAGNTPSRLAPAASRGPGVSPRPATGLTIGSACQPVTPRPANGGAAGTEVGGAPGRCWGLRAPGRRWGLRAPRSLRGGAPAVPLRRLRSLCGGQEPGGRRSRLAAECGCAVPNPACWPSRPPPPPGQGPPGLRLHFCRVQGRRPSHRLRAALRATCSHHHYSTEDKRLGSTPPAEWRRAALELMSSAPHNRPCFGPSAATMALRVRSGASAPCRCPSGGAGDAHRQRRERRRLMAGILEAVLHANDAAHLV